MKKYESEELILGFDARVIESNNKPSWDNERKEGFLLRLDILQPFSTDTIVWPSVFDFYGLSIKTQAVSN